MLSKFSYSYDLTHTLQYMMTDCKLSDDVTTSIPRETLVTYDNDEKEMHSINGDYNLLQSQRDTKSDVSAHPDDVIGVRTEPEWKFVWNKHLLRDVIDVLHPDWILFTTQGFISQSKLEVFGKNLHLTLIARRSSQFAGLFNLMLQVFNISPIQKLKES